jgi:uncharacterized DUF497 family protein
MTVFGNSQVRGLESGGEKEARNWLTGRRFIRLICINIYAACCIGMEFEYDPERSRRNAEKHGIDCVEGQALWDDSELTERHGRGDGEAKCRRTRPALRHSTTKRAGCFAV